MASVHPKDLKHAVHVLSCWNGECKPHVDRLVQLLEEKGVRCVSQARGDYGLGGLFTARFQNFFNSCGITIIHICGENIERVKEFEQLLRDGADRTCFIRIPCSPSASSDFIKQFNVLDLSDEHVLKRFLEDIVKEVNNSPDILEATVERPMPGSIANTSSVKTRTFKTVSFIHRGAEYPVMHVDESFLLPLSAEENIRRTIQECDDSETFVDFSKEKPDVLFFVLNEVFPDFYKQGQITRLALVTRCQQPILRNRALRYIQLLLLLNKELTLYSLSDIKKTEMILFDLFTEAAMSQQGDTFVKILVTYLVTLVSYIMSCHSEGNDAECDGHLDVITQRKLFQDARFKYSKKKYRIKNTDTLIKVLQKCVLSWQRQKCQELNSKNTTSVVCSNKKEEELATKDLQLFLLISSVIQLNKDGNIAWYSHWVSQMNLEYSTHDSHPKPFEILLANISICGLTTFLEHTAKNLAATSNVSEDCREAMKILSESLSILDVNDRLQQLRQLTTLYFHHNKEIRTQSAKLYSKENKIITMTHNLWENLLLTSEDILIPLIKGVGTEYSFPYHLHWGWTVVKQDFDGKGNRLLMHVLCPSTKEHQEGVGCDLEDERLNELRFLKDLQHPHIVQLQAFSESVWPQFYITEDYINEALQTLLVNKSRKNDFYPLEKLVIFLIDAIEGVQYLHSKNIVHRHLTAAHLFISTSGQVKLSGLMHACKLSENRIRDLQCSLIPTRWSAPESLKQCEFSKMSDMWMVGHLLYEVLTHGKLPYADGGPDDYEVMRLVVKGTKELCQEACIPKTVHNVISQLTNLEPSSRLSKTEVVIDQLQSLVKQLDKDMKNMTFPDLKEDGQAATEHKKGPVASVLNTYFGPSDVKCSKGSNTVLKLVRYKHHGPVAGLMHIKENCPAYFSGSVLSHLASCHFPGISPLISQPRIVSKEKRELSFWLHLEHSTRSLANAVSLMWLGKHLEQYIQCLTNIATAIADLHSCGLVLCDFSPYTIYIEKYLTQRGHMTKVWFGSLTNIHILHPYAGKEDHHIKLPFPEDSEICRAAPEVVKDGLYSHASDVFCFGRLMWWVINTFYETKAEGSVPRSYSQIYHKIEDCDSLPEDKPLNIPNHIFNLIKWCCAPDRRERPQIDAVQDILSCMEEQLPADVGEECSEDGDNDKCDNTSDSSGFRSYKSNTESELGSAESISLRCQPQQEAIPCLAFEPPPFIPRRKGISSLSPRTLKKLNAYSSTKSTPENLPSRKRMQSTSPPSPPPTPPPLPPSRKKPTSFHYMLRPHSSPMHSAHLSSLFDLPSLPLRPLRTKHDAPSSPDQPLQKPSPPPDQQESTKPQKASTLPSSLQKLVSLNSHQVTSSSSIVDPDSLSWPGRSLPKENLERKWTSEADLSGCATRKMRRKTRNKSDSVKELSYEVADSSSDIRCVKDAERSGATVHVQPSSNPGMKSFTFLGTRGQIQEALRIITDHLGQKEEVIKKTQAIWLEWVQKAFPDLETRAIFVPPVSITRVPMVKNTFAGHQVFTLTQENVETNPAEQNLKHISIQKSDILDDEAFQRVLFSLKTLSKVHREVFVCLSQLPFGSYLGNPDFYPATAHLPLPHNLPETWPISWRQGDFDVLLIHKQYGFVICELKAMVYDIETSKEERSNQIAKTLNDAKMQLDKAEAMLSHLVSDVAPDMNITKTIVCPNLTSLTIKEVLTAHPQVQQNLFQCFKLKKSSDLSRMIICSDHLCDPEPCTGNNDKKIQKLFEWWKAFVCESGSDTRKNTCPDLYRNLIARFCGPASTVTVPCITEPRVSIKTMGQAVSHVGDCYTAHIILFPEQIELLNKAPLRVFIVGPPGTGKTTVLLLMATEWLRHGNDVYVLSTWESSVAATLMLHHLLQKIITTHLANVSKRGQVLKKILNRKHDLKLALDDLTKAASKGDLRIIADEVGPDHGPEFPEFCTQLLDRCKQNDAVLHLWAASCFHKQAPTHQERQDGWELLSFTRPLRSPPSVIQEIKKAVQIKNQTVQDYSERGVPDFTDGPPVHWVIHQGPQHSSRNVEDCNACGKVVATFLHDELLLGVSLTSDTTPSRTFSSFRGIRTPEGLKYSDVIILSFFELREASPILKALSSANIPVQVMRDWNIENVATAESDVVWAARQHLVRGLERKVVVCLANTPNEKHRSNFTRLFAMSRCSSQLIVVCPSF